jgi:hypothetical protein
VKRSSLAYNRHETRDKTPLGRDPDRSWCHRHPSVKLFWLLPMASWTSAAAYECAAAQCTVPPAPVRVPSQRHLRYSCGKPQLGDLLMKRLCDQLLAQMGSLASIWGRQDNTALREGKKESSGWDYDFDGPSASVQNGTYIPPYFLLWFVWVL